VLPKATVAMIFSRKNCSAAGPACFRRSMSAGSLTEKYRPQRLVDAMNSGTKTHACQYSSVPARRKTISHTTTVPPTNVAAACGRSFVVIGAAWDLGRSSGCKDTSLPSRTAVARRNGSVAPVPPGGNRGREGP
jgi:hypothetical protein